MSLYDVFFDLTRLEIHLWDRVDRALRDECATPLGGIEAMLVMRRLGTCRVQDVSREMAITVGGASKLVDRLESAGHCVRKPNPDDRRSSLITLTALAGPLLDRADAVIEATLASALGEHLTADELAALASQLGRLRRLTAPEGSGPTDAGAAPAVRRR